MFTLLEIELRKLVPSRDFWLSATAYVILMPLVFISLKFFSISSPRTDFDFNLYAFPGVWHNFAYVALWVDYLLYVIVLQTVTHEYQLRTIRQNVIDGLSRWQYLSGKVMLLFVFTLGSALLVGVLALLGGLFLSETPDRSQMFGNIDYVGLYSLELFGYLSLAMLIATLVRKTGLSILAFTGYALIVEPLLRALLLPRSLGRYLPSYLFDRLVPNPFFGHLGMAAPAPVDPATIVLCGVYIIAFVLCSGWLIAKQDL
jgi:ABC-2 type transport system permease protein